MKNLIFLLLISSAASAQITQINNVFVQYPLKSSIRSIVNKDTSYNLFTVPNDSLVKLYNSDVVNKERIATNAAKILNLQTQIDNIEIPQGVGIPQPNIRNTSYTLQLSDHNTDVYMDCSGCTITVPVLTPGFKCNIKNSGLGTVQIRTQGTTLMPSSVTSMSKNSTYRIVKFKTDKIVEVR